MSSAASSPWEDVGRDVLAFEIEQAADEVDMSARVAVTRLNGGDPVTEDLARDLRHRATRLRELADHLERAAGGDPPAPLYEFLTDDEKARVKRRMRDGK